MNNNFGISNGNLNALLNSNFQILYFLGICFANDFSTGNPDHYKVVDCYMQTVVIGNIDSVYCIDLCYANGWGMELNHSTACQ